MTETASATLPTDDPTRFRTNRQEPSFPELSLQVRPLDDPVLARLGHDPRSAYVEEYWLSIIGPSALLFLRRLAAELEAHPDGFDLDLVACAQELGLGSRGGKQSAMWRTLERVCRFGLARRSGSTLAIHRRMPPLTTRQIARLPEHLRTAHVAGR